YHRPWPEERRQSLHDSDSARRRPPRQRNRAPPGRAPRQYPARPGRRSSGRAWRFLRRRAGDGTGSAASPAAQGASGWSSAPWQPKTDLVRKQFHAAYHGARPRDRPGSGPPRKLPRAEGALHIGSPDPRPHGPCNKHAKLQRLHRVPTHFRELANLPEPQDASGRARVLLPHFACNLITESGAWALIGYNGNSFHVATNNERGQRIVPACKEGENR